MDGVTSGVVAGVDWTGVDDGVDAGVAGCSTASFAPI